MLPGHSALIFQQRYDRVKAIAVALSEILDLPRFYPGGIDVFDALINKIGGYNCALDTLLRHIERRPWLARGYSMPCLGKAYLLSAFKKRHAFEIPLVEGRSGHFPKARAYDVILLATLENYLGAFANAREVLSLRADARAALIVPEAGLRWGRVGGLKSRQGLDVIPIEASLPENFRSQASGVGEDLAARLLAGRDRLDPHMRYRGVTFGESWFRVLLEFVRGFVGTHVVVTHGLYAMLRQLSSQQTRFCVARERRSVEGAFVQIGNRISGNTAMIMHAILSFDLEKRLFTGHFQNVARVYGWGQHDHDMITFRQQHLGLRLPEIVSRGRTILALPAGVPGPVACRREIAASAFTVLFAAEPHTNQLLPELLTSLPPSARLIVRPHPSDRKRVRKWRIEYAAAGKLAFDVGEKPLRDSLSETDLFVSFSSTTVIESLGAGVPTLVLDYPALTKDHPRFFREGVLNGAQTEAMFVADVTSLADRLQRFPIDALLRKEIRAANELVKTYFIAEDRDNAPHHA